MTLSHTSYKTLLIILIFGCAVAFLVPQVFAGGGGGGGGSSSSRSPSKCSGCSQTYHAGAAMQVRGGGLRGSYTDVNRDGRLSDGDRVSTTGGGGGGGGGGNNNRNTIGGGGCGRGMVCGGPTSSNPTGRGGPTSSNSTGSGGGGPSAPPPVVFRALSLALSPSTVRGGKTSSVTWNTGLRTACTITGTNGHVITLSGVTPRMTGTEPTPAIQTQTTYTLACTDAGGVAEQKVTIRLIPTYQEF